MTKLYGNLILTTTICILIFWIFMALRPAEAARIRCGSSWEICAQREKGPGLSHPIIRDNIRRALIDPNRGSNRDEKATPPSPRPEPSIPIATSPPDRPRGGVRGRAVSRGLELEHARG